MHTGIFCLICWCSEVLCNYKTIIIYATSYMCLYPLLYSSESVTLLQICVYCVCVCVCVCACVCVRVRARARVCVWTINWINILRNPNITCEILKFSLSKFHKIPPQKISLKPGTTKEFGAVTVTLLILTAVTLSVFSVSLYFVYSP